MITVLTILHIIISITLILVVLLQSGKGSDLGAMFGGGASQTVFGAGGGKTFMIKLTTGLFITFIITSFMLANLHPSKTKSSDLQKEMQKEAESGIPTQTQQPMQIPITTAPDATTADKATPSKSIPVKTTPAPEEKKP
ncbi:MAG: preprotein translocase subunit SecG [Candidatus Firestonebacteria bacterium]